MKSKMNITRERRLKHKKISKERNTERLFSAKNNDFFVSEWLTKNIKNINKKIELQEYQFDMEKTKINNIKNKKIEEIKKQKQIFYELYIFIEKLKNFMKSEIYNEYIDKKKLFFANEILLYTSNFSFYSAEYVICYFKQKLLQTILLYDNLPVTK